MNKRLHNLIIGFLIGLITIIPLYVTEITHNFSAIYSSINIVTMVSTVIIALDFIYSFIFIAINPIVYFFGDKLEVVVASILIWGFVYMIYKNYEYKISKAFLHACALMYILTCSSYHFLRIFFISG